MTSTPSEPASTTQMTTNAKAPRTRIWAVAWDSSLMTRRVNACRLAQRPMRVAPTNASSNTTKSSKSARSPWLMTEMSNPRRSSVMKSLSSADKSSNCP